MYGVTDVAPASMSYDVAAVGSLGGKLESNRLIDTVSLFSGQNGVQYNFWLDVPRVRSTRFRFRKSQPASPGLPPVVLLSSVNLPNYPTIRPAAICQLRKATFRPAWSTFTWHLSVIDDGQPRGDVEGEEEVAMLIGVTPEQIAALAEQLDEGEFTLAGADRELRATEARRLVFGMPNAVAVTGDFDGDGDYEVGIFSDGNWYLDVNGNGVFDHGDLYAKLGRRGDRPVTGDWDGDGKTDIGIYGPQWNGDRRAMRFEPGIPDSHNHSQSQMKKNVPPTARAGHRRQARTEGERQGKAAGRPDRSRVRLWQRAGHTGHRRLERRRRLDDRRIQQGHVALR